MSSSSHALAFTNSRKVTHHAELFWDPEWPNAREGDTSMCHFPVLLECVAFALAKEWVLLIRTLEKLFGYLYGDRSSWKVRAPPTCD